MALVFPKALMLVILLVSGYAITSPLGANIELARKGDLSLTEGTYVLVYDGIPVSSFEADPGYYTYIVMESGNNTGMIVMCSGVECPKPRLVLRNSTIGGEYFFELNISVGGTCPQLASMRLGNTVLDSSFIDAGLIVLRAILVDNTCTVKVESTHLTVSRDSWLSIKFNVSGGSLIIVFGPLDSMGDFTESPSVEGDSEEGSVTIMESNEVEGLPEPHTPEVGVNIKGEDSLLRMLPEIALATSMASLALAVVSELVGRRH